MCKHVADQGEVDTSKHNDVDFVERSAAAMDPHQPAEEALGFTAAALQVAVVTLRITPVEPGKDNKVGRRVQTPRSESRRPPWRHP